VVTLTVLVTLLKGLSLHLGATVLFRLPDEWPVIGGPITLESLVWSSVDALSILTLLAVFAAFSAGADYYALLRSLPSFLHQVGLVTSIAITFVPQTVARFSEIRDAAALRGHRIRRVGDLLPLIIPLLAGGMDRSMNLAEAMEARGFSRYSVTTRKVSPIVVQCGLIAATMLLIGGGALLAFEGKMPVAGWAMLAAGAITLVLTLRAEGRGSGRTRLRRAVWREQDTVLASLCLGAIGFLVAYWGITSPSIYYPFPDLYVPPFDPVVAAVLWSLAAPAVLPPRLARPVRMRP
jgi:energy-coupling factor transport system permease protein